MIALFTARPQRAAFRRFLAVIINKQITCQLLKRSIILPFPIPNVYILKNQSEFSEFFIVYHITKVYTRFTDRIGRIQI